MDHLIPDVPLECLQAILRLLIQAQDPEATFRSPDPVPDEEPKEPTLGK